MAKKGKKTESLADAESVKMARKQRWNPLRQLSPTTLTRALDAFEYGDLREFALLAEVVSERDDTLKSVKPKREKAISRRDWNVMKREKSAAADKHADVLDDFWNNVRAENAYDRNERGGMSRLIKQMMTSVSFKYACHHIVWKPEPGKLRAVFEFVPLWFFENRTGKLRFVKDGVGVEGEEMDSREWMVTTGDGLMIACLIGYLAKRHCIQDWLAFSEKFSMPGTLGRTSAAKGSDAGNAMRQAVESFGQDWAAVIYGDDGNSKIELVQPNGNPSAMPMPALIERVDRKMAALYRGADLSTMSSKDGEGTGASLQSEETDILEADDCEVISETLRDVEREVIAWHFGKGVEPLAFIQIQPPVREDKKFVLEAGKALVEAGVRVSKKDYLDRLGFAEADADEEAIGEKSNSQNSSFKKEGEANAYDPTQPRAPKGSGDGGKWTAGGATTSEPNTPSVEFYREYISASDIPNPSSHEDASALIEDALDEMGVDYEIDKSGISESRYIIVPINPDDPNDEPIKIRLSSHPLPGGYAQPDINVSNWLESHTPGRDKLPGSSWTEAVKLVADKKQTEIPAGVRKIIDAGAARKSEAIGRVESYRREIDAKFAATEAAWKSGAEKMPHLKVKMGVLEEKLKTVSGKERKDVKYQIWKIRKQWEKAAETNSTTLNKRAPTVKSGGFPLSGVDRQSVGAGKTNHQEREDSSENFDYLRTALAADLQPLGDALYAASQAGDIAAVKAALRKISKDMPEFMGSEALADLIGTQMMQAISEV